MAKETCVVPLPMTKDLSNMPKETYTIPKEI